MDIAVQDPPAASEAVNFRLVHVLRRRIRMLAPALTKDPERAYIFEILLRKHPGISRVRAVPAIGSVVIHFNPRRLPRTNLYLMLDRVLENIGHRASGARPVHEKQPEGPDQQFSLAIEGMTCASCALLLEMTLERNPGVKQARINFAAETASVKGWLSREALFQSIQKLGYGPRPMDTLAQRRLLIERERARLEASKRRALWAGLLSLPVMLIGMAMPRLRFLHWLEFLLSTPVVLWAGRPFFDKAWKLARQRATNMDTLIALGTGAAYGYSIVALFGRRHNLYFEASAAIISFVLLGRYLEERSKGKANEAIRGLIQLQPRKATLLRDGEEVVVDAEQIAVGDLLLIRPGERVPTDGEVIEGVSSVDDSMITGESIPVIKEPGQKLFGGCINGSGALRMRATAVGGDTLLAGIIRMVEQAQATKLPLQKLADRIASVFVPGVMALAGLTFVAWLGAGGRFTQALGNSIAVLLIACPCAVGLATPIAVMVGTGQAARQGIYIRNGESLEATRHLTTIAFDKTGTVTEGRPRVVDLFNLSDLEESEVLLLAASAELDSEHFLGQAIVTLAREQKLSLLKADDFHTRPGWGIEARVDGRRVTLGNSAWLGERGIETRPLMLKAEEYACSGKTPVLLGVDGAAAALFGIADQPREGIRKAIEHLHALGIETLMLTGDTETTARYIAREVGITEVVAQATPEQKLSIIRELQAKGAKVGMIGDGINDAPALTAANVSFAVGTGTDIAIEAADMVLVSGDITKITELVDISAQTMRIIKQNLFWALGYNTIAIPVAAIGKLTPMIASAAMALSSVSVVANSLRIQRRSLKGRVAVGSGQAGARGREDT